MQIRFPNFGLLHQAGSRLTKILVALCIVCFSLTQTASQLPNTKRITAVHLSESSEGSRVTVTGDSLLDDYEAFRRGERFYVRIPAADFTAAQPRFQGHGFEDVQVQKVGDSVVISFRLHPGANARVIGAANRLDVIFTSPNHLSSSDSATAVRSRFTRNAGGEKNPPTRVPAKAGKDIDGPMPPDSPLGSSDSSVSSASSTTVGDSRSSRPSASAAKTVSANGSAPVGTPAAPIQTATPYPTTSPYSSTYPPASATYSPASLKPVGQTSDSSLGLKDRGRAAFQWLSTNKKVSLGVGIAAISLLGVVLFLAYRRRRNRRFASSTASRVQPKYSPEGALEEMLTGSDSSRTPERDVDLDAYENWDESNSTDGFFFEDLNTRSLTDVNFDEAVGPSKESWEYIPDSNPQGYNSRVQEEREVFEL